ncbi:MAG: exodeoxyribonuclease VII large subunit [bacterium]
MEQLSFENLLTEEKYYTVSELTREIKFLLETSLPEIWVQAEISNFTHHSSGHMYFSLKDEKAQISCVMWRTRNQNLFFTPQDGMKVIVQGRVTVYEKRGNYQLDIIQIQPAGVGELQLAFEQLKNRLREEGLFSEEFKKPIPLYPERIGLVTSPTGAAIRDMITILHRRFPAVEIILNSVRVQGEGAAAEIARAIDEFNQFGEVDVLIVGRGGGSLEDLWAFNEEMVARAVFRSQIPVISAVGHEVDFSICDFVADLRAPTPSAAAELTVRSRLELMEIFQKDLKKMTDSILDGIKYQREKLHNIESSYAFRQPLDLVKQHSQRLDELKRNLTTHISHKTAINREILNSLIQRLSLLDHRGVLKRGYSLCFRRPDRKLIKKATDLEIQDEIEIDFYEGKAFGTVDELSPEGSK